MNWMKIFSVNVRTPQIWPIFSPPWGQIFGHRAENRHLIGTHARFEVNWTKNFWDSTRKPSFWWMDVPMDVQTDRQALTNAMSPSDFFSADDDSKCKYIFRFPQNDSTGIGLATLKMPYGHIDLGHHSFSHWLVAWWHQAINWANVGFSSKVFCGTHLRPILHKNVQDINL